MSKVVTKSVINVVLIALCFTATSFPMLVAADDLRDETRFVLRSAEELVVVAEQALEISAASRNYDEAEELFLDAEVLLNQARVAYENNAYMISTELSTEIPFLVDEIFNELDIDYEGFFNNYTSINLAEEAWDEAEQQIKQANSYFSDNAFDDPEVLEDLLIEAESRFDRGVREYEIGEYDDSREQLQRAINAANIVLKTEPLISEATEEPTDMTERKELLETIDKLQLIIALLLQVIDLQN
jgi:tetratricopeptide (TPR) repeat protein